MAAIIGEPSSIFVQGLADFFAENGLDVVIVTYSSNLKKTPKGLPIISSCEFEGKFTKYTLLILKRILIFFEKVVMIFFRYQASTAMESYGGNFIPKIAGHVISGISISRYLKRQSSVKFVFGQQAFNYGLATAMCKQYPRVLMPWGGDIFNYAQTTPMAFHLTRWAMMQCDLVCPTSIYAEKFICEKYRVPNRKVKAISWGIDTTLFYIPNYERRKSVCEKYGIDINARIVMNVRRFHPGWGSDTALKAFLDLASQDDNYHFIVLGGAAQEYTKSALELITLSGVEKQFTIFHEEISLFDCADLMSISHVFVSLMRKLDMRSSSILQAAACGSAPILTDQPEYREIERLGFTSLFVKCDSYEDVVKKIKEYFDNPKLISDTRHRNFKYIQQYENRLHNLKILLDAIENQVRNFIA